MVVNGIYQLEGDKLQICSGELGSPRPTEFEAKVGGRRSVMILSRVIEGISTLPGEAQEATPTLKKMPVEGLPKTSTKEQKREAASFKDFLRRIPIIQLTEKVKVTLTEGKFTLDTKTVPPCNRVVFHLNNTGKTPQYPV